MDKTCAQLYGTAHRVEVIPWVSEHHSLDFMKEAEENMEILTWSNMEIRRMWVRPGTRTNAQAIVAIFPWSMLFSFGKTSSRATAAQSHLVNWSQPFKWTEL